MQLMTQPASSNIAYRETGNGAVVLFIHGWMMSGQVWNQLLPGLSDLHAIIPDLRGSGRSVAVDQGSVTLKDHVSDVAALCRRLQLRDVHLVGHSMGGQIAMLLAAAIPDTFSSMTLLNPVPVQGLAFPDELQPMFRNCGGDAEMIGRIIDMSCLKLDPTLRAELLKDAMNTSPAAVSTGFEAFRRGDNGANVGAISVPTCVIATDDPFLPPAFLHDAVVAQLPNARLQHLEGAGHYPHVEMPAETLALLRSVFA